MTLVNLRKLNKLATLDKIKAKFLLAEIETIQKQSQSLHDRINVIVDSIILDVLGYIPNRKEVIKYESDVID